MLLKEYQKNTLTALRSYFQTVTTLLDPGLAFYKSTSNNLGEGIPYKSAPGMDEVPFVCIRIPTGGGKTLVATHSVKVVTEEYSHAAHPFVIWLAPSDTIVDQTLKALRNRKHPYNEALRTVLGEFRAVSVTEALRLEPGVTRAQAILIISTVQSWRVDDKTNRRVYEDSQYLKGHFTELPEAIRRQLHREEGAGEIAYSLENLVRMHQPLVVVDEAHNTKSELSFKTLKRLNPSCILEFTATPDRTTSNILYQVSAAELKVEEMIKIPILLETRKNWKALMADAIALLSNLDQAASIEENESGQFVRPLMLFQAEPNAGPSPVNVDAVMEELLEQPGVKREHIAISTGDTDELAGIDLQAPHCQIRFIVTVQKLREGWDCPFAYVLCSFQEVKSATAVEQILGRILRMPYAKRKEQDMLNQAYAYVRSTNFGTVAQALTDSLVKNGFENIDAKALVQHINKANKPVKKRKSKKSHLGPDLTKFTTPSPVTIPSGAEVDVTKLDVEVQKKVEIRGDQFRFKLPISDKEKQDIEATMPDLAPALAGVETYSWDDAQQAWTIAVPRLVVANEDGTLDVFDESVLLEIPMDLSDYSENLNAKYFSLDDKAGDTGKIDVDDKGRAFSEKVKTIQGSLVLLAKREGWNDVTLAAFLDTAVRHPEIRSADFTEFAARVIQYLERERKFELGALVQHRIRLAKALSNMLDDYRQDHRKSAIHLRLSEATIDESHVFIFPDDDGYGPSYICKDASHEFKNHLYEEVGELKNKGEEYECAVQIDTHDDVVCWVRNLDSKPAHSYWLQAIGKFYPDFVALLRNGKVLVIEYKGKHLETNEETNIKRIVGEHLEAASHGKVGFVMFSDRNWDALIGKIAEMMSA